MKKLEKVFWGMFLVGLFFKVMHWPFASVLTVYSLTFVSLHYFIFGFGIFNNIRMRSLFKKESYSTIPISNLVFGFLFGWSLSIVVLGFLFKFMLWSGANVMLQTGLIFLIFILAIYFVLLKQEKVSIPKKSFLRVLIVGLIGLSIYVIQSGAIIDFYYPNDKNYAEILKNLVKDPNNIEYQEAFDKARHERVRQDILEHSSIDIDENN